MLRRTSYGQFVGHSSRTRWVLACVRLGESGQLVLEDSLVDKVKWGKSLEMAKAVCQKMSYDDRIPS